MSRLIDADVLLEQMRRRKEYVGRPSDPVCLVEDAPTAVGWNATKDRQPDKNGIYLAQLSDGAYKILYYATNLHTFDKVSFHEERPGWCEFIENTYYEYTDVTHWRFLPKPPKDDVTTNG